MEFKREKALKALALTLVAERACGDVCGHEPARTRPCTLSSAKRTAKTATETKRTLIGHCAQSKRNNDNVLLRPYRVYL